MLSGLNSDVLPNCCAGASARRLLLFLRLRYVQADTTKLPVIKRFACFFLLSLALGASQQAAAETLTVFAAASLREALDDLAKRYEAGSGDRVVVSYAASSALARQIENGAPAELFISADIDWMDYLAARKLIRADSRINLLSNRLVMIAPAGGKINFELKPGLDLAGLLGRDRLVMADPDHVPAGKYGRAALESLGLWSGIAARVARVENVRACLLLVARGEAPLGIVYRTDAQAERGVRIVAEFAATSHRPIVYPAALTTAAKSPGAARLLQFLGAPSARAVWGKYGFLPP